MLGFNGIGVGVEPVRNFSPSSTSFNPLATRRRFFSYCTVVRVRRIASATRFVATAGCVASKFHAAVNLVYKRHRRLDAAIQCIASPTGTLTPSATCCNCQSEDSLLRIQIRCDQGVHARPQMRLLQRCARTFSWEGRRPGTTRRFFDSWETGLLSSSSMAM